MSEKIFFLLLRLYPARFRARYGEESLQLLRDRLHDETGLWARIRLGFDLLCDTATALPQTHRIPAAAISQAAVARSSGLPSFSILESHSLRPATLVLASIIGIATAGTFAVLLRYAGINHASRLAMIEKRAAAERRWTNGGFLGRPVPPSPPPSLDTQETPVDNPSTVIHPRNALLSTTESRRPVRAAAPGSRAQPPAPLIVVLQLGPEKTGMYAIPVPALEKQFGIPAQPVRQVPSHSASAAPSQNTSGRGSIVVLTTQETHPCPATTSETGSKSSIKPANSAASAKKSPPCSKSPRSPTGSANPASPATPQ
jgi:hypothetical protein